MSERQRKAVVVSQAEAEAVQARADAQGVSWSEYVRGLIRAALEAEGVSIPYVEVEQRQPPPQEATREKRRRHAEAVLARLQRTAAALETRLAERPWDSDLKKQLSKTTSAVERQRAKVEAI